MPDGDMSTELVFLHTGDALAQTVNSNANFLYRQLKNFDTGKLAETGEYKDYFVQHHLGRRLFFSLQNSAHIIYQSVVQTGKPANEISFLDYGAGLGTLFMLAGLMGFKKTVYNDYLPGWQQTAQLVCDAMQIKIDAYVTGDIDAVMNHAAAGNIRYDIVASRNVIEHIYDLPRFYTEVFKHNPKAVTYSTTTANFHNPVMRWYHAYVHNKGEKNYYLQQRIGQVKKAYPSLSDNQQLYIAKQTRGKAQQDFITAVNELAAGRNIKQDNSLRTNSCDCVTGVWNEHLLKKSEYHSIISKAGFKMKYTPGYCDTHYAYSAMNILAALFNKLIALMGNAGTILSPFVNVIAYN